MNFLLYLLPIVLPMAAGACILGLRSRNCHWAGFSAVLLTGASVAALPLAQTPLELRLTDGLSFLLNADKLSFFFLVLIAAGFAAASLYAREYFEKDAAAYRFYGFALLTLGAMMGLAMAGNLVTFYMFYEMMSLLSFPMVLHSGGEKARHAALSYLGFSVFGACLVLMGILLGGDTACGAFAVPVGDRVLSVRALSAYLLIALGFSCKAGMMPLANWLPTAHPVAPAPASALFSGIITKAGILGILRATFFLFGGKNLAGTFPQTVMLILSIVTIFSGSMLAYKETLLKKRLAYSSVSQLSYIIFAMMLLSPAGLSAALLQVLFHACAKVGLFLCAGSFIHSCGVSHVEELTGMGRRMPRVMGAFTCFALSLVGIPPFGGFISKWEIASAALDLGTPLAQIGVVVLMVSALLTAGYLLSIVARAYFPGEGFSAKKTDGGLPMILPLFFLAFLTAVLGIFPEGITAFFRSIASGVF